MRELIFPIPNRCKEEKIMAIIAIIARKAFTKEVYEMLRQEVGWETEPI